MKTKKDVLEILRKNPHEWCAKEVGKALRMLENFEDETPLTELSRKIPSEWAYCWGKDIGDRKIMRSRVAESEWAYEWGLNIGDREIMRDRVMESKWAYYWGLSIGDREIMRDRVVESRWAYYWGKDIGDREIMRDRVGESEWARLQRWPGVTEEAT